MPRRPYPVDVLKSVQKPKIRRNFKVLRDPRERTWRQPQRAYRGRLPLADNLDLAFTAAIEETLAALRIHNRAPSEKTLLNVEAAEARELAIGALERARLK